MTELHPIPNEDLLSRFEESSDQIGFLRENQVWEEVITELGPDFSDAAQYFEGNVKNWDGFFLERPELFFKFLRKFKDPLSIVSSSCQKETLINMMADHFDLFENLVLKSRVYSEALGQNYDCTVLLKISFEHDKSSNKLIFSLLIRDLPEINDATLQEITGLTSGLKDLSESVQGKIAPVNIEKYLKHASESFQ